jgi:hypothetical protein
MHIAFFSILLSPRDKKRLRGEQEEPYRRLLLLPKYLPVGLAASRRLSTKVRIFIEHLEKTFALCSQFNPRPS